MTVIKTALTVISIAAPIFAQDPVQNVSPLLDAVQQARIMADDARNQAQSMRLDMDRSIDLNLDLGRLDRLKGDLSFLQQNVVPFPKATRSFEFSGAYDQGVRDLDEHKYDQAIGVFDRIIAGKTTHVEGALYWKAYALNRLGRSDEALASIAALRKDYASSRWLGDAQVLEAEVKQNAGRPVSPATEANDDIKLMAINSLMNADPDRAIPLLENLLKGTSSIRLKERALFVLTQSKSPRAEQILTDYAKGAGNPDLQLRAIRYIGQSGTTESQQRLVTIYSTSADSAVKAELIRSLQSSGAYEKLLELARNEKDPALKLTLIQNLAVTKGANADALAGMYSADNDVKTKHAIIDGLFSRRDARPLVELARKENDPAMKKYIVERLSNMRNSKEATDYMLELLK